MVNLSTTHFFLVFFNILSKRHFSFVGWLVDCLEMAAKLATLAAVAAKHNKTKQKMQDTI